MKATQQLHDLGQRLWLDNITRELLTSGTLARYISELSVTGLTSNPTIFDHAIQHGGFYDDAIRAKTLAGLSGESLFFELALEDLMQAADLFRPVYDASGGVDGWASLEVSPRLADEEAVIAEFTREGINDEALAAELQREGVASFAKSWSDLIACIVSKSTALTQNLPGGDQP